MERKLASVQVVSDVVPVIGISPEGKEFVADSIELVRFRDLAWQCVSRKDDGLHVGDLCIFVEIDSRCRPHAVYDFLRPRGYKVKTARFLKTTLSQGVCFPMSVLWQFDAKLVLGAFQQGDDVSEIMGVEKCEKLVPSYVGGDICGPLPVYIPKTAETRIQSAPQAIEELRGHPAYATVKMPGCSGTFYLHDGHFGVCSRKVELKDSESNVFWQMAHKYDLENVLRKEYLVSGKEFALQGEVCGPNLPAVHENLLGLKECDVFFFDLWEIGAWEYRSHFDLEEFCERHGLKMVPVDAFYPVFNLSLDGLLESADGWYGFTGNLREGIVVRPAREMKSFALGGRLSFKVVSNEFLLAGGE